VSRSVRRALSRSSGLDLRPATIRNVLADLEELALSRAPIPRRDGIPTPRGYRFFVDTLLTVKQLDRVEISQLEVNLHPDHPQRLISAGLAASLRTHAFRGRRGCKQTQDTGLPSHRVSGTFEKRVLLIIVTPDGDVQNRILFTEKTYTPSELTMAANFLNQNYAGLTFDDIRRRLRDELKQLREDMTLLMTAALEAGSEALSGLRRTTSYPSERNLLDSHELASNMSRLRELFELFETKTLLMQILELSTRAQECSSTSRRPQSRPSRRSTMQRGPATCVPRQLQARVSV